MNSTDEIAITFPKELSEFLIKNEGVGFRTKKDSLVVINGMKEINDELRSWRSYRTMIQDIDGWEAVYREAVRQLLLQGWKMDCHLQPTVHGNSLLVYPPWIPCVDWKGKFNYPALVVDINKGGQRSKGYNYSELDHFLNFQGVLIDQEDVELLDLYPGERVEVELRVEER